jgi:hypothetical protein
MNVGRQRHAVFGNVESNDKEMEGKSSDSAEEALYIASMVGFTGKYANTLLFHPHDRDSFACAMGRVVVICSLSDSETQRFLCDHDEDICALAM